jgi:hypothetical protein
MVSYAHVQNEFSWFYAESFASLVLVNVLSNNLWKVIMSKFILYASSLCSLNVTVNSSSLAST